jgi:hypothetical protein
MTISIREHNLETNEIIDRTMTESEEAVYLAEVALFNEQRQAELEKKETKDKAIAKLAALGLTEEEAKLLLS